MNNIETYTKFYYELEAWNRKAKNKKLFNAVIKDLFDQRHVSVSYILNLWMLEDDKFEALRLLFDVFKAPFFSSAHFDTREELFDFLDRHSFETKKELDEYHKIKKEVVSYRQNNGNLRQIIMTAKNIPNNVKAVLLDELHDDHSEKKTQWVRTVLRLPLVVDTKYKYPKSLLHDVKIKLDEHISFMSQPKTFILMYLNTLINNTNVNSKIKALGLYGGMGLGKTYLVQNCLAKALQCNVYLIKLGGVKNSTYLSGHDYTYVGSQPGIIVRQIINDPNASLNSIFLWDEVDKIEHTDMGQAVIDWIADIIDPTKNSKFHDDYIGSTIDIDLSHSLHIFTLNNRDRLKGTSLEDRIEFVHISDLNKEQKLEIVNKHLMPRIQWPVELYLPNTSISRIIDIYCHNEAGVRQLERNIQKLLGYIRLQESMGTGIKFINNTVSTDDIDTILKLVNDNSSDDNDKIPFIYS